MFQIQIQNLLHLQEYKAQGRIMAYLSNLMLNKINIMVFNL